MTMCKNIYKYSFFAINFHQMHRACETNVALQRNWYPSPIAGLFSYQAWNGFVGFWQNGAVLETFANFMHYGNNTRYQVQALHID